MGAIYENDETAKVWAALRDPEFIKRFMTGGKLPLITSCCPAWTDWMEKADDLLGAFLLEYALSRRNRFEAVRRGGYEVLRLSSRRACGI